MVEEVIKARYRNKVGKIIIEVFNGEKWIYVKTLSDPLIEFQAECLAKVSYNKAKIEDKTPETFAQAILTEPQNKDTLTKKDDIDIQLEAKKALDKLMKEIIE